MRRDDTLFVKDIIAAMQAIEQFVESLSLDIPELNPRLEKILTELDKLNSQL